MSDTIIRSSAPIALERWPDRKIIYVEPEAVVLVEPATPAQYAFDNKTDAEVTALRLYSLGGTVLVYGNADDIAVKIQRVRYAMAEITMATLIEAIHDEIKRDGERKRAN